MARNRPEGVLARRINALTELLDQPAPDPTVVRQKWDAARKMVGNLSALNDILDDATRQRGSKPDYNTRLHKILYPAASGAAKAA